MSSGGAVRDGRVPALDGLRGVAIILVVASHISGRILPYAGNVGVTIFFGLSGYLITGILVAEYESARGINLAAFYMRRILRLYPALLVMLIVFPLLMLAVGDADLEHYWSRAGIAALYLTDFFAATGGSTAPLTMTWSLAVEEQFYLLWPLVLLGLIFLLRRRHVAVAGAVWSLALTFVAWRVAAMFLFGPDRVYFAPDTVAFSLLLGCALAVTPHLAQWLAPLGPAAIAPIAILALLPGSSVASDAHNVVALLSGVAALPLLAWAGTRPAALLSLSPLRWFGSISYGLYLWHQPLMSLGVGGQETAGVMRAAAAAVAVLVAWLSFVVVERPALRLKRRFERAPERDRGRERRDSGSRTWSVASKR